MSRRYCEDRKTRFSAVSAENLFVLNIMMMFAKNVLPNYKTYVPKEAVCATMLKIDMIFIFLMFLTLAIEDSSFGSVLFVKCFYNKYLRSNTKNYTLNVILIIFFFRAWQTLPVLSCQDQTPVYSRVI